MLASIFVVQGYQTLRRPEQVAPAAEPVVRPLADRMSFLTDDTEQAVRINGAVHLVAGSLLAAGRLPRLSALALAVTLVPTTWAGHRFWEAEDEQERAQQKIHFLKNLTMMGGLLIAAADTGAKPSVVWRSRHALHDARRDVSLAARTARTTARAARGPAAVAVRTSGTAAKARKMPAEVAARTGKAAGRAAKSAGKAQAEVTARTAKTAAKASRTVGKAAKVPAGRAARAGKRAGRAKGAAAGLRSRAGLDGRARKVSIWSGKAAKSAAKASARAGKTSTELAARGAETAGRAREMSAVAAVRAAQAAEKAARRSADAAGDVRRRLPVG